MKKIVTIGMVALLGINLFTGCGSDTNKDSNNQAAVTSETDNTQKDSNLFANLTSSQIGEALYYSEKMKLTNYQDQHKKVAELLANMDISKGVEFEVRNNNELVAKQTTENKSSNKKGEIYIGELTPDRRPNGWGILYSYDYKEPILIGEFKNGHLVGYAVAAIVLTSYSFHSTVIESDNVSNLNNLIGFVYNLEAGKAIESSGGQLPKLKINDLIYAQGGKFNARPLNEKYAFYIGEIKRVDFSLAENKYIVYDAAGREIFKADSFTPVENNTYNLKGKGHEYYSSGELKYEGDAITTINIAEPLTPMNHFNIQGYGTSYKQDGTIEYQGEWINGQYK